jgi:hypothetical protein
MNKRGQFYLVAAMIIISIMLSFMAYQSHLRTVPVSQKVYDLGKELDLETAQVLDYGVYSSPSQQQDIMQSWANNFSQYSNKKAEQEKFVFIYCETSSTCEGFESSTSTIDTSASGLGRSDDSTKLEPIVGLNCNPGDDKLTCTIGGIDYEFNKDESFYFVIKGTGGEVAQK